MAETLKLCVSCKACRRECPTGVDMARMKIEVLAARAARGVLSGRDRFVGYLPRYAPIVSRLPWLLNLRDRIPGLAWLSERVAGFSARRSLPRWRRPFREPKTREETSIGSENGREVVLFVDTFSRYFEPENVEAALMVLEAAGCRVHMPRPVDRPLCCGRTFLSIGQVEEARHEAQRCLDAFAPYVERGIPVVGLEPSCLIGFRDEIPALIRSQDARDLATHALMFEEFITKELGGTLPLAPIGKQALLHGHCHQKSFALMDSVMAALKLIPELAVEPIESSCCGMAGAFGYGADTIDVSLKMGELSLLPAVRKAAPDTIIVADGTSCRHQIKDGTGREALHVARLLAMSVEASVKASVKAASVKAAQLGSMPAD
jgi:Fe-S oxidoreductase